MVIRDIRKLVEKSYKNNALDKKTVQKIASLLTVKELRVYIKLLKLQEQRKTVTISLAEKSSKIGLSQKNSFKKLFKHKNIAFNSDESLLGGVRVVDYDIIYDISLKGILEDIALKMQE